MKFGVREICDVVFKAGSKYQKVGDRLFLKGQPILYFDSLKISTLEQQSSTVYAQGGRGNSRLISWDGDKIVSFTIEDALISSQGLAILTQSHLLENKKDEVLIHKKQRKQCLSAGAIVLDKTPDSTLDIWVAEATSADDEELIMEKFEIDEENNQIVDNILVSNLFKEGLIYEIDYYFKSKSSVDLITITPESFGGNFYVEASTLFRDKSGQDILARFIIPNCKPQSNFSFNLSPNGDPTTFTFVLDAFPGYTNFDPTKKVLAAIQIIDEIDLLSDEDYINYKEYGFLNITPSPEYWFKTQYINDSDIAIIGLTVACENEKIINIPYEIDGKKVVSINSNLDENLDLNNLSILRIPASVQSIGGNFNEINNSPLLSTAKNIKYIYVWEHQNILLETFNSIDMPEVIIITLQEIYDDWDDLY